MGLLRKHVCGICSRGFNKIEELMHHEEMAHGKDVLYECRTCKMAFANGEDLKSHARQYHTYKKKN